MGGSRYIAAGLGATGVIAALLLALFRPLEAPAIAQQNSPTYMGVASCGGTTCHGRSEADGPVVRQDELMIWQDPSSPAGAHSRAYAVLRDQRSQVIAQRLGIGQASTAPECLSCHATPGSQRGPRFLTTDGVGCEACHGPASGWLSSHYAVGGTHENNVSRGLRPLENPRVRAGVCLDCHFGSNNPDQFVTHRLMAAGHPRISFELDLFTTLQAHHQVDRDYRERKRTGSALQTWAVGQAMALDRSLSLYLSPSRGMDGMWPEFFFFDCHSCHRRISDDPNSRPTALANPGRPIPPGYPPYNDENIIMLSAAARIIAPQGAAQRFEQASRAFHQAMRRDRAATAAAASQLRDAARALAAAFESRAMGPDATFAIINAITSEAISPRFTDYAGSVQAVMATDTLLSALVSDQAVTEAAANRIRADINIAYRAVRDPNAYSPGEFRASLGRAAAAIRRLR